MMNMSNRTVLQTNPDPWDALSTNVSKHCPTYVSLCATHGLGRRFAFAVAHKAGLDPYRPVGTLTAVEEELIAKIIENPFDYGIQPWMFNFRFEGAGPIRGGIHASTRFLKGPGSPKVFKNQKHLKILKKKTMHPPTCYKDAECLIISFNTGENDWCPCPPLELVEEKG